MNQNDQMREALRGLVSIVKIHSRTTKMDFAWAELEVAEQALAAQTAAAEPAKLVRLTDDEISRCAGNGFAIYPGTWSHSFATAIMDAMIKKNGGTID